MRRVNFFGVVGLGLAACWGCDGQMTREQKRADFSQLAAVYAINYGPTQWKREALGVDLLDIGDWLVKAGNTENDLDFYEVCVAYVASLNDAHDAFLLPSDFEASLGFTTDIYDGNVLVDSIDRKRLDRTDYPFQVGDEIVSIDGVAVKELLDRYGNYAVAGNALSSSRVAAELLTTRPQALLPHAPVLDDSASVVVRQPDGGLQTYSIPWRKAGSPVTLVGPVISPFASSKAGAVSGVPEYLRPLTRMRNMRIQSSRFVRGFGATGPVFNLPADFQMRLGAAPFDFFYSGVLQAQGLRIGYIRIPNFDGGDYESADFQNEITFFEQNTDGLIVDLMRNPGGDACFAEDLLSRLNPTSFRTVGLEIRATRSWVADYLRALEDAVAAGAGDAVIQQLQSNLSAVQQAFHQPSGRTAPLPVCGPALDVTPAQDRAGHIVAYTKPILLLTDEFTASAGDLFAAVMQDNRRALLFGNRTMGAGGNVNEYAATTYSEGASLVTESLMSRKSQVIAPGFPASSYIENVGVRPDIVQDYMTLDNLLNNGASFVKAFTDAMVNHIYAVP